MAIYKPSELKDFLRSQGIFPKKALSQNFLIDGNVIQKILTISQVQPDDLVLEIGPGPGALTEALLEKGVRVIAVEKDEVLASALNRFQTDTQALQVHCEDIMEFDIERHLKPLLASGQRAKVIANLPYHLTTPILAYLIKRRDIFSSLTLMVQEEVARRFTAKPNTSDYSSFTLFLNYFSEPKYQFMVKKGCFYPEPSIDSAIVFLKLITPTWNVDEEAFFTLTRRAFEQRRKMLRSSLKEIYEPAKVEEALAAIIQDPQARPEKLSLQEFIQLFKHLNA